MPSRKRERMLRVGMVGSEERLAQFNTILYISGLSYVANDQPPKIRQRGFGLGGQSLAPEAFQSGFP
jgi:hypothetical protein